MESNMHYLDQLKLIVWLAAGTYFREKGPCLIADDGIVRFSQSYTNSFSYSRQAGPSKICPDGEIEFTMMSTSEPHRTTGPAAITYDGNKEYWVNGKQLSPEEFFATHGVV